MSIYKQNKKIEFFDAIIIKMATLSFIRPENYPVLTESQVYEWRKLSFSNIGKTQRFTLNDLLSFKSMISPSKDELIEAMSDSIKQAKILGKLKKQKNSFIYIDSSTLCKISIPTLIKKINKKHPMVKDTNMIFVYSQISRIENMYKFSRNYPDVNYKCLQFNLDLLSGKLPLAFSNTIVITTNLLLDNKVLFEVEKDYLSRINNWYEQNVKNELNDNAQILMMQYIVQFFNGCNGYILSHDKKLCSKVENMQMPALHIINNVDMY